MSMPESFSCLLTDSLGLLFSYLHICLGKGGGGSQDEPGAVFTRLDQLAGSKVLLWLERHRAYCPGFGVSAQIPRQQEKPPSTSHRNNFENWKGLLSLSLPLWILALQELWLCTPNTGFFYQAWVGQQMLTSVLCISYTRKGWDSVPS